MTKKPVILVVDDLDINIKMVAEALGKELYTIIFAKNGRQALDMAARMMPDLVLLDIVMPELSGLEVCRQLKSNPLTADMPVIFLTAQRTGDGDILAGFEAGGADYVTKPFNHAELNARVRTHLDLKFRTEALRRNEEALRCANEDLEMRATELEKINQQLRYENEKRIETERELLRYQSRLRSMTAELVLTEEQERRRAAIEIHESIGQIIGVVKIKLRGMKSNPPGADRLVETIDEILEYIEQTIRDIRSVSYDLSPPILYEMGLEAAIASFIEKVRQEHRVAITLTDDHQDKQLDIPTRIHLFRCIQELIYNSINHAAAQHVTIAVRREGEEIQITITDDGTGFDSSQITFHPETYSGFGLFNVRERMMHLGGRFRIQSRPGNGSRIYLSTRIGKPV